jgi:hypothetical protein
VISLDRFLSYVESVRNVPFSWGTHDCLTFSNAAVTAYRGHGYADDWLYGYTTELGAAVHCKRLLRRQGFSGIVEAVDSRLTRYSFRVPPRGCVIARPCDGVLGYAFGIVVSDRAAFVGGVGLDILRLEPDDVFWRV